MVEVSLPFSCSRKCRVTVPCAASASTVLPSGIGDPGVSDNLQQLVRLDDRYIAEFRIEGDRWKATGPRQEIALTFAASGLSSVRQVELLLEPSPASAFEQIRAAFVLPDTIELDEQHDRIVEQGAIIGEPPLGTIPKGRHFPRRNRIISGVSLGVVVIEAAKRSGSLITARLAGEQGREVFAVPGSPLDARCTGTNGLIRQGAILTEGVDDVTAALAGILTQPLDEHREAPDFDPESPAAPDESDVERRRQIIIECLGPTPVSVDEIIRQCQVTASVVLTVLLELELAGRLDRHPGNQVSLNIID
ncbi:MAG: DNA-protecting protein DprA [Proteobacteria bacterium]|nr:DNA-protecting protein DprA [Pseudomonadota bacterium]